MNSLIDRATSFLARTASGSFTNEGTTRTLVLPVVTVVATVLVVGGASAVAVSWFVLMMFVSTSRFVLMATTFVLSIAGGVTLATIFTMN